MASKNIASYVSEKIITHRRELDISQSELAFRIGFSQAFIHQIESGKRTVNLEQLNALAIALNCTIYALLPETPIKKEDTHEQ